MSLILIKDPTEIKDWNEKPFRRFSSTSDIQMAFCHELELDSFRKKEFLRNEAVTKYLNSFGVEYKGNYILDSEGWGIGIGGERFVTHLYYSLQLACLALYHPEWTIILSRGSLFDKKHLKPILEQRDIYLQCDSYYGLDAAFYSAAKEEGCEIIIEGRSSKEFSNKGYFGFLMDVCCFIKYDKETNTIEICDRDKGLLEFHRLLQESTDLLPSDKAF